MFEKISIYSLKLPFMYLMYFDHIHTPPLHPLGSHALLTSFSLYLLYVLMHIHAWVHVDLHVYACGGQRLTLGLFAKGLSPKMEQASVMLLSTSSQLGLGMYGT